MGETCDTCAVNKPAVLIIQQSVDKSDGASDAKRNEIASHESEKSLPALRPFPQRRRWKRLPLDAYATRALRVSVVDAYVRRSAAATNRQEISWRRIRDVTSATNTVARCRRNCHVNGMTDIAHSRRRVDDEKQTSSAHRSLVPTQKSHRF